VLVAAARERHGDRAVLHALSSREQDEHSALRVLSPSSGTDFVARLGVL
jgi:hypothetical protein